VRWKKCGCGGKGVGAVGVGAVGAAVESAFLSYSCALEVPTINYETYKKEHRTVCQGYELAVIRAMDDAAKIEAELAIQAGDINTDGTPLVAVVADGSWCKRSYKTMYNSPSGMVRYSLLSYTLYSIFNFV